jgi:hypothetical protein
VSWSSEEVKKAEDVMTTLEMALSPPVSHEELVTCVSALAALVRKLIADKKWESEGDALVENMDENGD